MQLSIPLIFLLCCAVVVHSIPVYVMLPLNSVNNDGSLNTNIPWDNWFGRLRDGGVAGVMGDVWWGIVESNGPKQYNWNAYALLLNYCKKHNLGFQVTMSFHKCGGNVNDDCNVSLPWWVLQVGRSNPDIFYTDRHGHRDDEYLSCGVDTLPLFSGRTPVQMYTDFVASFVSTFNGLMGSTVRELQIGLGPAGEMRYPSYQLQYWGFPGVGEFQCYDRYLLAKLNASACAKGHCEWGRGGPNNAGDYNCNPCTNPNCGPFFTNGFQNFASDYGQFFLNWYMQTLLDHGENILRSIRSKIPIPAAVTISTKVSGIHWQFQTPHHGAELTAGYKNDKGDAYRFIASMLARYNVAFDFTCLEMRDSEQPAYACSSPENLVGLTLDSTKGKTHYQGENALPRYDPTGYGTIEYESRRVFPIDSFSYLRLSGALFDAANWGNFQQFVRVMNGK